MLHRAFANQPSRRFFSSTSAMLAASKRTIDASFLQGKHFTDLFGYSGEQIQSLLDISHELKEKMGRQRQIYQPLVGRSMSMIFQKRSTRTRVSTETGFHMLGGHALFLSSDDIQLGKNESLRDTARVLSRYNDIVLARVYGHSDIVELSRECSVPVINALSDTHHPLQGLADLMTLQQTLGAQAVGGGSTAHRDALRGRVLSWVGDGNNIAQTFLSCAAQMGFHLQVATPKRYEVNAEVRALAEQKAAAAGVRLLFTNDPFEAVCGADVIVTDTWVSMGQEEEKAQRLRDFQNYQVTEAMARQGGAKEDWVFLHCLPRKPDEVDDEVFYSPKRSLVFDEAENRMWTVMAVALAQLQGGASL